MDSQTKVTRGRQPVRLKVSPLNGFTGQQAILAANVSRPANEPLWAAESFDSAAYQWTTSTSETPLREWESDLLVSLAIPMNCRRCYATRSRCSINTAAKYLLARSTF